MSTLKPIIKKVQIHLQLGGSLKDGPARSKEIYDELSKLKPVLFHSNISTGKKNVRANYIHSSENIYNIVMIAESQTPL